MAYLCNDCPRQCGALRGDEAPGHGLGHCRMGEAAVCARIALHHDEEPCLSGVRGSGAVFFSGCSLKCVYCQNEAISHRCFGAPLGETALRRALMRLIRDGAHNINLVNPTHYASLCLRVLEEPLPVPVVWNSGGYERVETLRRLQGKVQIYLPDLKYVDAEGAKDYSSAPDYFEYAAPALREMLRQTGPAQLDEDGIMRRGTIVRHLILPGRVKQSIDALTWIAENLPGAWVSLMAQYTPCGPAMAMPPLDRKLAQAEYDQVVDRLFALGLEDGYVQELEAASTEFIPAFDLTGVSE